MFLKNKKIIMAEINIQHGTYRAPVMAQTNYFIDGWWSDEKDNPIRNAYVGQTIKFHITTINIPNGEEISFDVYDWEGLFFMDDKLNLYVNGTKEKFDKVKVSDSKGILSWTTGEGSASLCINEGTDIELYVKCSYKENNKIKLPLKSKDYLKVSLCISEVVQNFNNRKYGSCDFYVFRYEDFLKRHKYCSHFPPEYYYGGMREIENGFGIVDSIKEWWTESLTQEMKSMNLNLKRLKKMACLITRFHPPVMGLNIA